ncbi:hypothetical protein P7K49_035455 [Saguinus oedipus]|uniref:Uncharacterized protein n=1 Tax=Saguinus oedipus TaxID=9490 RepID=A0ABQ9TMN1_SAGOE|nr:hypothetical protein P7K49_035455 [Saguinus oedipus]
MYAAKAYEDPTFTLRAEQWEKSLCKGLTDELQTEGQRSKIRELYQREMQCNISSDGSIYAMLMSFLQGCSILGVIIVCLAISPLEDMLPTAVIENSEDHTNIRGN